MTSERVQVGLVDHTVEVEGYPPFQVVEGESLLVACEEAGVPMESDCGGFACCNACRVEVLSGAQYLSPRLPEEDPFLDAETQRLGCQARVCGPVLVRLAPGL